jgi:hypothetical protein
MPCYVCAERGTERTAVRLRSCQARLRLERLRETAAHLSGNILAGCHHNTWASECTAARERHRQARASSRSRDAYDPTFELIVVMGRALSRGQPGSSASSPRPASGARSPARKPGGRAA